MSTKEQFATKTFRDQSGILLTMRRESPDLPFHIGKSAAYLQNAADYMDKANEILAKVLKDTDDNSIANEIRRLLE